MNHQNPRIHPRDDDATAATREEPAAQRQRRDVEEQAKDDKAVSTPKEQ